jgi:cbb3-type cytochrome oxidase subunit 3
MPNLWEIFWILAMLGLVIAVSVVAFREKKAQAAARKNMALQSQAMDQQLDSSFDDGFGEPDPVDSFGTDDDFASFDEKAAR